jgi:hypothetical protein
MLFTTLNAECSYLTLPIGMSTGIPCTNQFFHSGLNVSPVHYCVICNTIWETYILPKTSSCIIYIILQGHYFIRLIKFVTSCRYSNDGRRESDVLHANRTHRKWKTLVSYKVTSLYFLAIHTNPHQLYDSHQNVRNTAQYSTLIMRWIIPVFSASARPSFCLYITYLCCSITAWLHLHTASSQRDSGNQTTAPQLYSPQPSHYYDCVIKVPVSKWSLTACLNMQVYYFMNFRPSFEYSSGVYFRILDLFPGVVLGRKQNTEQCTNMSVYHEWFVESEPEVVWAVPRCEINYSNCVVIRKGTRVIWRSIC